MEKKYLNGNLSRNITFGLCWLLSWIPALIVWIVDKDNLDLEDKRELASIIICAIASTVLSLTFIVPLYVGICGLIAAIMAFMGKTFQIPGVYHIAAAIIK
ncbi:MAG: hypothetical protein J6C27_01020 [Clostridia bacterium]|nr:hypothetical protein [Clostridia bacterium]